MGLGLGPTLTQILTVSLVLTTTLTLTQFANASADCAPCDASCGTCSGLDPNP